MEQQVQPRSTLQQTEVAPNQPVQQVITTLPQKEQTALKQVSPQKLKDVAPIQLEQNNSLPVVKGATPTQESVLDQVLSQEEEVDEPVINDKVIYCFNILYKIILE